MDDRQTQIRSGAGLDESRINQDFLDFLSKWSTPVLWLLVLVGGAWWGLRFLKERRIERVNQAFAQLTEATSGGNPSPATLRTIATEFGGVESVSELALLSTADIYLRSAIAGVEPGSEIDPATGRPVSEDDVLDESRAKSYLSQAADMARQVIDSVGNDQAKQLIAMEGWMRLAAAQEGLGSLDEARSSYTNASAAAAAGGYPALAKMAEQRAEAVGSIDTTAVLPSRDALVPLPGEEPAPAAVTDPPADTGDASGADPEPEADAEGDDKSPAADEPAADPAG